MVKSKVNTQFELPKNDKTDNSQLMI